MTTTTTTTTTWPVMTLKAHVIHDPSHYASVAAAVVSNQTTCTSPFLCEFQVRRPAVNSSSTIDLVTDHLFGAGTKAWRLSALPHPPDPMGQANFTTIFLKCARGDDCYWTEEVYLPSKICTDSGDFCVSNSDCANAGCVPNTPELASVLNTEQDAPFCLDPSPHQGDYCDQSLFPNGTCFVGPNIGQPCTTGNEVTTCGAAGRCNMLCKSDPACGGTYACCQTTSPGRRFFIRCSGSCCWVESDVPSYPGLPTSQLTQSSPVCLPWNRYFSMDFRIHNDTLANGGHVTYVQDGVTALDAAVNYLPDFVHDASRTRWMFGDNGGDARVTSFVAWQEFSSDPIPTTTTTSSATTISATTITTTTRSTIFR